MSEHGKNEGKQAPNGGGEKRKRRGYMLVGLFLLALAVLVVFSLFLRFGWRQDGVAIKDDAGDPSALRGFTLTGTMTEYKYINAFTLRDGNLEQSAQFAGEPSGDSTLSSPSEEWVVADAARAATESAAVKRSDGSMRSEADTLSMMYRIYLQDVGYLRVCVATVKLETPAPVVAYANASADSTGDYLYAVTGSAPNYRYQDFKMDFRKNPYDGKWYAIATIATDAMRPGIYRVDEGLTTEQINALPKDVSIDGKAVHAGTQTYGKLTPVATVAKGLRMQNSGRMGFLPGGAAGSSYLLYKTDETFRLDIVDLATGQVTDTRDIDTLPPDDDAYYVNDGMARNQLVFETMGSTEESHSDGVALVENGKIQACVTRTQGSGGAIGDKLLLSADGTRVMVITQKYGVVNYPITATETVGGQANTGFSLQIYPIGKSMFETPLYVGSLCPASETVYVMNHTNYSINSLANAVNWARYIIL